MKKTTILGFVALLQLAGCAFKTPPEDYKTANPSAADPVKIYTSSLESTALQPLVFGNWQGSLPCADCEGITYSLTLQKDKTFQETSEYRGKNGTPFVERGTWSINEDSVVQLTKASGQSYLHVSKTNLVILDHSGQRITSELADKYVLHRVGNSNTATNSLEALRNAGVDFIASGGSWNLEIDSEKAIVFRANNNKIQLTSQEPTVQKLPGGKGSIFRAITDAGTLSVRVTNQPCSDKSSGQTLPYTVEVTANAQAYNGCGQFLNENTPVGKWTLQEMNGQALKAADFSRGLPTLELQTENNRVSGDSGCNRISGEFKLEGQQVTLGKMISTRMACPGPVMTFENNYLQLISDKAYTFELNADQLTLKDQNKAVLVYKKSQ